METYDVIFILPLTTIDDHCRPRMGVAMMLTMGGDRRQWTAMDVNGRPWASMVVSGPTAMDVNGRQWTSMDRPLEHVRSP